MSKNNIFFGLQMNKSPSLNTININMDELSQLINRLSELFKKYINQLKINITQNREIYSFIDRRIIYVQTIIKNIINHNYTFEQLKLLEETVNQIKEKNNENKSNVFNDEQNLIIFIEETNVLFKSIKLKYKIKLEEWSNYKSISASTISKNNPLKINKINNIIDNKKNFYKISTSLNNNNIYEQKRTNSTDNKDTDNKDKTEILSDGNNSKRYQNIRLYKSQKFMNEKNNLSWKGRSARNKKFNLFNHNIPMSDKSHSIYNIDVKNDLLLNKSVKNYVTTNLNRMNRHSYLCINNKSEKQINNYEKTIENLNEEILKYKQLIILLNKNKNDINETNNNVLMDKLKRKEKEIISKDKKIKLLYQEINKYKYCINNMSSGNNKSDMNSPLRLNGNNNNVNDFNKKYNTESNLSNSIIFNNKNTNSNERINNAHLEEKYSQYKSRSETENGEFLNHRLQYLEKENNLIKSKLNKTNYELIPKCKRLEKENILFKKQIIDLKRQLKKVINVKEDLSKTYNDQKKQYEYEISQINDKRNELSKFLSNKHSEITNLQQEIMTKDKELENYKLLLSKKENKINKEENEKIKQYYKKLIKEKETKEIELNSEINILNKKNDILNQQNEKKKKEISKLNINIKELEDALIKKKEETINTNQKIKNNEEYNKNKIIEEKKEYEIALKKLKEENDGLKEFTLKQQKLLLDNEKKEEKINILQKEKEALKQYFIDMEIPLPFNQSSESVRNKSKKDKNKTFQSKFTEEECFNILIQLNEAKKEIASLKKKNEQLFNDLDNKKLKTDCFDNVSVEKPLSNYEEEFDLRKMSKGVKDKNRSQDINIDYPGIQHIKEKYRELDFYYNSLEDLVKKMLLSSTCTNKNKAYIIELCKIVGFNDDITKQIVNNKNKKGILNMFV